MRWKQFKYLFVSPFEHHSERTVTDKVLPAELEAAHSLHGSKTDGHCSTRSGLTGYLLGHNHVHIIHLKIRLHTWQDVLIRAKSRSYNKARCGDAYTRCAETRIMSTKYAKSTNSDWTSYPKSPENNTYIAVLEGVSAENHSTKRMLVIQLSSLNFVERLPL